MLTIDPKSKSLSQIQSKSCVKVNRHLGFFLRCKFTQAFSLTHQLPFTGIAVKLPEDESVWTSICKLLNSFPAAAGDICFSNYTLLEYRNAGCSVGSGTSDTSIGYWWKVFNIGPLPKAVTAINFQSDYQAYTCVPSLQIMFLFIITLWKAGQSSESLCSGTWSE